MNDKHVVDAVALFTALAAILFSPSVASMVGPYFVIVAGATLGASFALSRRDRTTRLDAVWFMARVVGLAILLTVGLAELVNAYRPQWPVRVLLAPIALLVGFIGDDWPALLSKVVRKLVAIFDLVRSGSKPDDKGEAP